MSSPNLLIHSADRSRTITTHITKSVWWKTHICIFLLIGLEIEQAYSSRYSQGGRRRTAGYNRPHDEVNFSLSQEEFLHQSDEDGDSVGGNAAPSSAELPEFVGIVPNVTVQIGREARLPCILQNLGNYRAAWIRDEEKNILTLQRQMVTRDPRIRLQEESQIDMPGGEETNREGVHRIRHFVLIIRNVQVTDRGGYMCQVNTVPMRSQIGYLRVVVPPEIIDEESSNDITVVEGANVTLKCKARGYPRPAIEWRKEDGNRVPLGDRSSNNKRPSTSNKTEGETLVMTRVTRVHSGAWLCIAYNGVMPSVSRRILLNVQFAPQIWIPVEEMGAPLGSNITLDCHIEAYPLPLNFWSFGSTTIYISGRKYEVSVKEKNYKRHLRLTIYDLAESDLGVYRCHAQNSLADQQKEVLIFASDTRQQTKAKQTLHPQGGEKKQNRQGKKKKKKLKQQNAASAGNGTKEDDEEEGESNYEDDEWKAQADKSSSSAVSFTLLFVSLAVWLL